MRRWNFWTTRKEVISNERSNIYPQKEPWYFKNGSGNMELRNKAAILLAENQGYQDNNTKKLQSNLSIKERSRIMSKEEKQEKKRLSQEELEKLEGQYYPLTDTLTEWENGMKTKAFKSSPSKIQEDTKKQFAFMKYSLNETLEVLMMHDALNPGMADHASCNKFVKLNTKFNLLKYSRRKRYQKQ